VTPQAEQTVQTIAAAHAQTPGGLLPALHAVQDALGHVPDGAVAPLAAAFNLSRAEVHGVLTFYAHFRRAPPGRHVVQVCRAEACQACGGAALLARAGDVLQGGGGAVTLQAVDCLGLCASAPAVRIDEQAHARVTPEGLTRLLRALQAQ
jgi:NADH:ubiquinone oxidoreductase subunit E